MAETRSPPDFEMPRVIVKGEYVALGYWAAVADRDTSSAGPSFSGRDCEKVTTGS